jgi:hypothetical protein
MRRRLSPAIFTRARIDVEATGPVRRVRTEVADLLLKDGKVVEGPRALMEVTVFDRRGRKVDRSVCTDSRLGITDLDLHLLAALSAGGELALASRPQRRSLERLHTGAPVRNIGPHNAPILDLSDHSDGLAS